eukprot:COSAG01_NODE_9349_length_2473_cov_2.327717_4_plen_249_part_00
MHSSGGEEGTTIVLDVGSNCTKAGYAGDDCPQAVFSSAVGTWADSQDSCAYAVNRYEAWHSLGRDFDIKYPVEQGLVSNWCCLEKVWDYVFSTELRVDPRNHPLMVVEQSFCPQQQRERMVETLFEKYSPPGVFLAKSAVLCCCAAGKSTGLIVEIGGGASTVVPVQEGSVLVPAIRKSALAGDMLTYELSRRVAAEHNTKIARLDHCTMRHRRFMQQANFQGIKESLCQFAEWGLSKETQVITPKLR